MRKKAILVLDSDEESKRCLIETLKTLEFVDIHICQNLEQVIEVVQTPSIQMILADWNLPDGTGLELLTMLRESQNQAEVKILMMIREGDSVNILEGMRAGMNGYIMKPFSRCHVQQKIEAVLQNSKTLVSSISSS